MEALKVQGSAEKKGAVYTVITADYDILIEHRYRDPEFDYYCYTDNLELLSYDTLGTWKIRPLIFNALSSHRNQRFHKLMPHLLFPEYEYSIYLDGNIDVLTPYLFEEIGAVISRGVRMAMPKHPDRNCIYAEGEACKSVRKDDPQTIDLLMVELRRLGYPADNGLTENNVIFRRHRDPDVLEIMTNWWDWIVRFSKRDQLSLMFVCWQRSFPVEFLLDSAVRTNQRGDFVQYPHKGPELEGTVFLFSRSFWTLTGALKRKAQSMVWEEMAAGLGWDLENAVIQMGLTVLERVFWKEKAVALEGEREHLKRSLSFHLGRLITGPFRILRSLARWALSRGGSLRKY